MTKTILTQTLTTSLMACALSLSSGCDDGGDLELADVEGLELQDLEQLSPAELEHLELALDAELDQAEADPAGPGEIQLDQETRALDYVDWGSGRGGGSENTWNAGYGRLNDGGFNGFDVTGADYYGVLQNSGWLVNSQANLSRNGDQGQALAGAQFTIEDQGQDTRFRIAQVNTQGTFHEYLIEYKLPAFSNWLPLCEGSNPWAVALKDVTTVDPAGTWKRANTMQFACTKYGVGKAKHWGYDPNINGENAFMAAIRVVTADYCGAGFSFTQDNTQTRYVYAAGQSLAPGADVEAGWNQHGVVCLNYGTSRSIYAKSKVKSECGGVLPPACSADKARSVLFWSKLPMCGDGIVDPGEECDEGVNNGQECTHSCEWDWGVID